MWLLFDIGNTRLKWRWADGARLLEGDSAPLPPEGHELELLRVRISPAFTPERVVICNVAGARFARALRQWSRESWGVEPHMVQGQAFRYGIRNGYKDPASLGVDRWCGLIGARALASGGLCVVDCGTAVTLDMLTPENEHKGGLIIPGMRAMVHALTTSANAIPPDVQFDATPTALGRNTKDCICAGVVAAIAGAVELTLSRLPEARHCELMLTGGDAAVIASALRRPMRMEPDLVFHGLADIAGREPEK